MSSLRSVTIAGREVGHDAPVFVVAEAGVCHFGSLDAARLLVDMAVAAQADAVKFQTYDTDRLVSSESPFWRERLRPKELSRAAFADLKAYCDQRGILFLSTPHEEDAADFLDELGVAAFKIGSGEVSNTPFLRHVARKGRPMIVSTGMYTLDDTREALAAIRAEGNDQVVFLHCVTSYPTPPEDVNLRAIGTLRRELGVPIGYSDHTIGIAIPVAAVAAGACMIEKHIALDKANPDSYDSVLSCDATDLPLLVDGCRRVSLALGSGVKAPTARELHSREWARKSIVALRDIPAGAVLGRDLLCFKRPGTGIPPNRVEEVVGRRTAVPIPADTLLRWEQLETAGAPA